MKRKLSRSHEGSGGLAATTNSLARGLLTDVEVVDRSLRRSSDTGGRRGGGRQREALAEGNVGRWGFKRLLAVPRQQFCRRSNSSAPSTAKKVR